MKNISTNKNYDAVEILHLGRDHFHSGQHLLSSAFLTVRNNHREEMITLLDSGGYLVHLGIELILKSSILEITGEFQHIHQLPILLEETDFNLNEQEKVLINEIENFYKLRYVKDKNSDPIGVGNGDVDAYDNLYFTLISQLPKTLQQKYEGIEDTRKCGRILMRIKID